MFTIHKKIIFSFFVGFVFLFLSETAFAGFGITPPFVRNSTLTRSSEFTQEIILVRGDPIEDLKTEISFNLPGIETWFTVDKGFEFILPAGEKQVPMLVTVTVPADAKYGSYTGNIRVRTSSAGGPGSGSVSLALGAQIDVDIQVVDEIFDFEVKRVELVELEQKYKKFWLDYPGKITFTMQIQNKGNVDASPSKVRFDIYDRKGNNLLETLESDNKIAQVAPFQTEKVDALLKTHLPSGGYLVKYQVFKKDEIARAGELTMTILPQGTVPGYVPYGIAGIEIQGANIFLPILMVFEGLSFWDGLSLIVPVLLIVVLLIWGVLYFRNGKKLKKVIHQARSASVGMQRVAPVTGSVQPIRKPVRAHGNVVDLSRKK